MVKKLALTCAVCLLAASAQPAMAGQWIGNNGNTFLGGSQEHYQHDTFQQPNYVPNYGNSNGSGNCVQWYHPPGTDMTICQRYQ